MEIIANLQYKVIDAKKTYEVRHPVLRKNLPLSSCYMELDDDVSTIHLGGFIKKKMVAVLSILINPKYSNYQTPNAQVRGMAVLNKYQSKGIGINMLTEAEKKINKHRINLIWLNARIDAVDFYKKCGFSIIGKKFRLEYGGEHFKMIKKL